MSTRGFSRTEIDVIIEEYPSDVDTPVGDSSDDELEAKHLRAINPDTLDVDEDIM